LLFWIFKIFFWISQIKRLFGIISDIRNNYFGYPNPKEVNCGYLKLLFWISEIVIFDIQNNYFGYQKLCQKGVLFEISNKGILDIKNNNFGYPKINIYFGYQK